MISETKLISLNSRYAIKNNNSFLSDLLFPYKNILVDSDLIMASDVQIISAEITRSFYIINYSNQNFKISIDNNLSIIYQIPVGNYTGTTLINQILLLLNDTNFIISLNRNNGYLTFQHNKTFTIYPTNYSINEILGFDPNLTYISIGPNNPYTLTPPYPLNLIGIETLYIYSNELQSENYSNDSNGSNLLMTIPVNQPAFCLINYFNYSNTKSILKNRSVNDIDIQIKDKYNNFINFNNINFNITIAIHIFKKSLDLNNINLSQLLTNSETNIEDKKQEENKPLINSDLELLNYNTKNK